MAVSPITTRGLNLVDGRSDPTDPFLPNGITTYENCLFICHFVRFPSDGKRETKFTTWRSVACGSKIPPLACFRPFFFYELGNLFSNNLGVFRPAFSRPGFSLDSRATTMLCFLPDLERDRSGSPLIREGEGERTGTRRIKISFFFVPKPREYEEVSTVTTTSYFCTIHLRP